MAKSLEITLWIVVGAVVFFGALKFILYFGAILLFKVIAKVEEITNMAQPRRVSLLPRDSLDWTYPEQVAQVLKELEAAGFVDSGRYEIKEVKGMKLQGLTHEEQRIAAVIYDHKTSPSVLDLIVDYEDGHQICYCNHQLGFTMPRPDNHVQKNFPGVSATELLSRMIQECSSEGLKPIPVERFAFWYEESYAEHARWLAERGGPTLAELGEMVKGSGNKADETTLLGMYENSALGYLTNWFRNQPDVTDKDWEEIEFGLVVIHDGLRLETALERFNAAVPEEEELELSDIPQGVSDPRQAFAALNGKAGWPFRRLKEKQNGLPADFYLEPGWEEEPEEAAPQPA